MTAERKHYVYRCYDETGRLLYIGCTDSPGSRFSVHRASWNNPTSRYLNFRCTRWEVEPEPYIGRVAGLAAEKAAIEAEAPLLNVHHNKGRALHGDALWDELERTRPVAS